MNFQRPFIEKKRSSALVAKIIKSIKYLGVLLNTLFKLNGPDSRDMSAQS